MAKWIERMTSMLTPWRWRLKASTDLDIRRESVKIREQAEALITVIDDTTEFLDKHRRT
jgi:hypothetical protein